MDLHPTNSNQQPDSRVPTLAPSARSVSDDGKVSAAPADQTDVDVSSANAIEAPAQHEDLNEKHDSIARQPTTASNTGNKLEHANTREDGSSYPTGMKLVLIVIALCLAVFLMALGEHTQERIHISGKD